MAGNVQNLAAVVRVGHFSNAVLLTWSRAVRGLKSLRDLEACSLVTATVVLLPHKFADVDGRVPRAELVIFSS
jgi:hypothetical protein